MEKARWAAVLGLDAEKIEAAIAGIEGVSIANYNCPGQIVITGWKESVEQAGAVLKDAGAKRVLPLNVSWSISFSDVTGSGRTVKRGTGSD